MGFTLDLQIVRDSRGDPNVRELLIEAIWPEAFRVALGIIGDRGLAEDTAQEACASIAIELPKLRSDVAFYAWMYRIIVRHATAAARRSKRTAPATTAGTSVPFPSVNVRLDVIAALAALPVTQRTAVVLHYYAGYTSAAVASVLKMPAPTVRCHLMLARRALKASLTDRPLRPLWPLPRTHVRCCGKGLRSVRFPGDGHANMVPRGHANPKGHGDGVPPA